MSDVFHIESMGPVERAYAEAMHEGCTDGPEHPLSAHSPWSGSDLDGVELWSEFTAKLARHGLTIVSAHTLDLDSPDTVRTRIEALLDRWEADGQGDLVSATAIRAELKGGPG